MKVLQGKIKNLVFAASVLILFSNCSKNNSEKPRTFVRLEVDGQVFEYFDDDIYGRHSFVSFANTFGNLYDTSSSNLKGRPAFFISYSGPPGKKDGDFWITWGTYSPDNTISNFWRTLGSEPDKRRFTVSQISPDGKSWSGDFYYEAENFSSDFKIVKGTYAIIGE